MNTDGRTTPPAAERRPDDADAYEAGLRAGYAHGYEIGREHARTRADADLDDVSAGAPASDARRVRLDGPDRDELIARGYIPVDHTRPPALPVRLWTAEDWAKADERDLPTTEYGRAQWRAAVDAGRVPARLAEPPAAEALSPGADAAGRGADFAADLARDVAATARTVAELRARLDRVEPIAAGRCRPDRAPWRGVDAVDLAAADASDRGIGR